MAAGDPKVTDLGDAPRFKRTGGGANSCDPDALAASVTWGLGRISGAIWWGTPV